MKIDKGLSEKVLMIGTYYKNYAPGGMAAVIQYYERHFENIRYISSWRLTTKLGKLWYAGTAYFKTLFLLTFDKRIQLLHIHTAADQSFYRKAKFVALGKRFDKKVIVHVHASRFKDFYNESSDKVRILNILKSANLLIVLSQSWKKWFESIGIDEENLIVLNNIVDYPKIKEKKASNLVNLLFLGEIGHRKGVFDILNSFSKNKQYLKDKVLFKIGGNREEKKLLSVITVNSLECMVEFEGWVSGQKKVDLLNWADVFILPSFNEGLPISILEAMSYGCAIISSPVGGIPEIIIPHSNGLLVHPGNDEEIFEAIKYLTENKDKIKDFGLKNQDLIRPYLSDAVIEQLDKLYTKLLEDGAIKK